MNDDMNDDRSDYMNDDMSDNVHSVSQSSQSYVTYHDSRLTCNYPSHMPSPGNVYSGHFVCDKLCGKGEMKYMMGHRWDVCMYGWMYICMDGWMNAWMYVWIYGWMDVCILLPSEQIV